MQLHHHFFRMAWNRNSAGRTQGFPRDAMGPATSSADGATPSLTQDDVAHDNCQRDELQCVLPRAPPHALGHELQLLRCLHIAQIDL
eukprot:CAMPEP_0115739054 /NCGR_PEP_ID=MMETSP0272-20121206/88721_1 /TAXON_ID=71861 /ORGANISM="Scrippsiella trochoidea, Strain CCMP3099" /LENGTH=86 /DNA_ID=CAMNT_0003183547 /DNA_START=153 /DNA_END=413 /DNA_ORIENTATION=-